MAYKISDAKQVEKEEQARWIALLKSEDARKTIKAMLKLTPSNDVWRGVIALPPGSGLEKVIASFKAKTPIPLEIPFFVFLHFVSGLMLKKGAKVTGKMGSFYSDIWTIVLADSGAGKTFAHDVIAEASPVKSTFPDCNSGAMFLEAFKEHNRGLWFKDEIAQKMKLIETPNSPVCEMKEYLLHAYSYEKIERSTKKNGTITVDKPCLGILGLNTQESFYGAISAESLTDGFAQRFSYVVAEADEGRQTKDNPEFYALYDKQLLVRVAKEAWEDLGNVTIHETYRLGDEAEAAFRSSFGLLFNEDIPESFYRRVMFKAVKYAMIYHVILKKETDEIDAEDMGWAARVCRMHLTDLQKMLKRKGVKSKTQDKSEFDQIEEYFEKATKLKEKKERDGKGFDARTLQQGVRGLNAQGAKLIVGLMNGE